MSDPFASDPQRRVERHFETHLDVGLHHGAQLAVYADGEEALNLAGGVDAPGGEEVTPDTRFLLFSCTKPFAGACVHKLVDEGALAYDDPVVEHWPEFADGDEDKERVTVRHVLSHQAGMPSSSLDGRPEAWGDWGAVVEAMEDAALEFQPGASAAYHALTYGWLVGELVSRASGDPIEEYARREIFEPLGMHDTSIGRREDEDAREATLVGFEDPDRCRDPGIGLEEFSNEGAADLFNADAVREAVVPAATGIGTARDMARFYACLVNGGELDGMRILSEEVVEEATAEQASVERDATLGVPRSYGLGFVLAKPAVNSFGVLAPERVYGHAGLGSSLGWGDPVGGLGFAYVTNGVRETYEHGARVTTMSEAVRVAFS